VFGFVSDVGIDLGNQQKVHLRTEII
jgi:hypothetical protein